MWHSLIHHVTSALQGLQFSCLEWKMYYCSDPFAQSLAEEELKSHWLTSMLNIEWYMPYRVLYTELYMWLIFWRIHRTVIFEKVCKGWIAHLSEQGGSETICIWIRLSQALTIPTPLDIHNTVRLTSLLLNPLFYWGSWGSFAAMSLPNSKDFRKTEFEANSDTKQPFVVLFVCLFPTFIWLGQVLTQWAWSLLWCVGSFLTLPGLL